MSGCARVIVSCCRIALHSCYQVLCCKDPPASCLEYDILCIGLTNAGKSTLLCQLLDENTNKVTPTSGFNIKAVQFEKAILNVKELGGGEGIRKYWSRYYQGAQGVIFVLDSASNEEDLEEARLELHCALQHPQLCTLPFLIFANHQDKLDARSIPEVRKFLELEPLALGKQWVLQGCSFEDQPSIHNGVTQFLELLEEEQQHSAVLHKTAMSVTAQSRK